MSGSPSSLRAQTWTAEQFAGSRESWNGLLEMSQADRLFMSWDWQHRWWLHHAQSLGASLQLLALHDTDGALVGLAPFYAHDARVRGIRVRRLELIGVEWRSSGGAFSEFLDIIAHRDRTQAVLEAVAGWLEDNRLWQDLAMPCLRPGSLARRLAHEHLGRLGHVREVDRMRCYSIALPEQFDDYARRLDQDTRRKVLNKRVRLREPRLQLASDGDIPDYLETLRSFELARWGRADDRLHRFNLDFAACQAKAGRLRLTRLTSGGRTLSVMLNARMSGTEYYLQSAFDPALAHGISPGYLHFGYVIESACRDGVQSFELLAGHGRRRDYKRDLLGNCSMLTCCHIVRLPWLRALYWTYDRAALLGR